MFYSLVTVGLHDQIIWLEQKFLWDSKTPGGFQKLDSVPALGVEVTNREVVQVNLAVRNNFVGQLTKDNPGLEEEVQIFSLCDFLFLCSCSTVNFARLVKDL